MKIKIAKTIAALMLLLISIILLIMTFYTVIDIQSRVPASAAAQSSHIQTKEFMGRNVFIITPQTDKKLDKYILYFHGGAYVSEATDKHWSFLEKVSNDTGATVIMPDYPLTPRYNYKNVFNMVEPLYKEIIKIIPASNLIVMGDSAGGGLALALEEKLSEENIEMPEKTILISPWLDVRLTNSKIDQIQKFDTELDKDALRLAGIAYSADGNDGINSYLVNPIDGDLSKLKNIIILTGTYDILNPDVHILKERAKKIGVNIEIKEYEKAKHNWMIEENCQEELISQGYQEIIEKITRKEIYER